MLLRLKRKFFRLAELPQHDIGVGIWPDRHVRRGIIGNCREQVSQLVVESLLLSFALLNRTLERGDLVHQALRRLLVFARLGLADFFGGCVAASLRVLQFLNRRAALLVEAQNSIQRGARACLEAAVGQPLDEGVPVVADPFDVEHGRTSLNRRLRIRPYYRLVIARLSSSLPACPDNPMGTPHPLPPSYWMPGTSP